MEAAGSIENPRRTRWVAVDRLRFAAGEEEGHRIVGNPRGLCDRGLGVESEDTTYQLSRDQKSAAIMKALGRYGKLLEDGTRKAADTTGNIWNHLRTAPNMADAAVARLAQGTKVYAEGGHERVFHQVFGGVPGEQLRKAYACYLSTSSGPVIGTLYLSTARLAFCSDSPVSYHAPSPTQPPEPMYYKASILPSLISFSSLGTLNNLSHSPAALQVVLPLNQVRTVSPSASMWRPSERYIQVATTDSHEFWFMGFVSYDKALKHLSDALQRRP
ncbi:hypothetical protein TRIUR3_06692 [Triticum urartu]|uniref:Uncharacterized protein n=1 Tax=Triticum urartu TaxID=4572 RepID=M7ZKN9_TRIUA|nr:hypothetical protein TRIUR3_06692 [Triticum urartu]